MDGWQNYDSMTVQQAEERVIACRDALNVLHQVQAISEVDAERAAEAAKEYSHALRDSRSLC